MRCNSSCMPCGYLGTTIRWAEETYRRIVTYRGVRQRIDVSRPMRDSLSRPESLVSKPIYYFKLAKIRLKYILKTGQT